MKIVYDVNNGDYIESEGGERFQLYTPYDEQAIIKAWEFGLKEAWEAARELFTEEKNGCVSNKSIIKAFNGLCLNDIFRLHTAKEAVKVIKDYEEKKAEKDERIEYLKHEDIKKDGKTVRVWYGGADSRCAIREKKENVQFPGKTEEKTMNRYRETIKEALSQTFEMMNKNKSEEEKENEMKSGDKFIIELGEKTRIQSENSKGEWVASDECFRIDGTGSVISAKDLMNLKEYKENNDGKENVKYVSPEMLEKINIIPGKGMKKFQEEKAQRAGAGKDSAVGKKFLIEIEKEEEGCYFELKGTNERYFETVCKIKDTNAYIKKADLDELEEYKKKPAIPREVIEKVGYEKGLNELWETLKQLQNMSLKDYEECTGLKFKYDKYDLYSKITPMELVEKFKEWKEKQAAEEEIKVGDEIISKCGNKAVVIHIDSWNKWHCLSENGLFTLDNERIYWEKTGKHYEEVEKIFQKLKESEGEIPFL